ncbi:hypothetical protein WQ54_03305 [Bacillus sp. SA1-12]|uniref:CotY/CotZ family spore coat protein n=1 Tax=Bacillus sp. SA1-12 TaxID=1455638 RepID=UPI0006268C13|nr:CotY/CotZ family spore coat protein [Bacillus sp. SA1-12]KKI93648.1 hypothetical protein WQ54_03305 [Bacillus sp. SA1-12]
MKRTSDDHYMIHVIETIISLQNAVEEQRAAHRYRYLLYPMNLLGDSIPILLFLKEGELFKAYHFIDVKGYGTVFFRVESIHNFHLTLRLLKPLNASGELIHLFNEDQICFVKRLLKTENFIKVDVSNSCAIQCLSPQMLT